MTGGVPESRALILRLALRAIRWRAATSATVFVVAVVAVLAATVGPIYLHAVDQIVLERHLNAASPSQRDVMVSRQSQIGFPGVDWDSQVQSLAGDLSRTHLFAPALSEKQVGVNFSGRQPLKSEIVSIQDLCAHVHIVRGRCVAGDSLNTTIVSANTAAAERLRVGGALATLTTTGHSIRLRVVGVYRPLTPAGSFWAPWNLFQFGEPGSVNQSPPGDAAFVTSAALSSRALQTLVTFSANAALLPGRVGYDDVGNLRRTLGRVNARVAHLSFRASATGTPVSTVTTSLPVVLDQSADETSLAGTLVMVATAQLALLALLVLYAVVANTAAVQGPEVALAKLRGRRGGSLVAQSVAQPVVLVVAAAPVGATLAWVLVRLSADGLLGHRVDVVFPPAALGVAALGVLGGIAAAIVAAHRTVVTPVGTLTRRGTARVGGSVGLLVADAAAVTIAAAGLIELEAGGVLSSGKPNPLAVLAPTLLAVAAAVVALRLLPFAGRLLARWTRDSPRVATFLAVRQLLRRPAEARAVLLVAVAVSIASFALIIWADSRHNRTLRALNSAGAHTVMIVRPGPGVNELRTAVDRADPSGHSMAVASTRISNLPPLIAVDTSRFASVGAWVAGNAPIPLASVLHHLGARPAPVMVTGTQLRLRVDLLRHPRQAVRLAVTLSAASHRRSARTVTPVTPGTGVYVVSLPVACVRGCSIAALRLTAGGPATGTQESEIDATVWASIRSGGGWHPIKGFADRARWHGDGTGQASIASAAGSLSLDVRQGSAPWPSIISAAIPGRLPAVVASAEASRYEGNQIQNIEAVGLDGDAVFLDGVIRAVTLPRVDRGGVMVDLGAAMAAMDKPAAATTHYQVWLSAGAPSDMAARLARQHVYVQRTIRSATFLPDLNRSGPAFADSLFLLSALAAVVLAVGTMAAGRVLSVRRRGYELAALEAVGISPRTLRRATLAEQGSVFAIGLLVGLAAGLVGSWLALPSTPVFVNTSTGPPLVLGLPWALLAGLTAGIVIVFLVVSGAVSRVVARAATPSQLRGAQQ